uniref:ABC transporter domain-containing protein n=1 Tax=Syphacia muris TaxID=451379 RepID=A0A0N5AE43_9BILA
MHVPSVDLLLLQRIKVLLKILFTNNQGKFYTSAPAFAVLTFIVAIADQVATYFVGILPSKFFVALGNRDANTFLSLLWQSVLIVSAKAVVLAGTKLSTSLFFLKCREICNRSLHRIYFQNLVFYKLNTIGKSDNPDQRMTQDIEKLTRISTQDLFSPIIMAPFIISYYTYLTINSAGWFGAAAVYIYFITSTVVNKFLLSPIVRLGVEQEKQEGNFRAKHHDVLSNVESIAFYNSGATENSLTNEKLDNLLVITNFFDYYGGTLSYLIIAVPTFLTKKYDDYTGVELTGVISKSAFIYLYLIYSFSRVVSLAELFGEMSSVAHRVVGLYEELQSLSKLSIAHGQKEGATFIEIDEDEAPTLASKVNNTNFKNGVVKLRKQSTESDCLLQNNLPTICSDENQEVSTAFELNGIDVVEVNDSSVLIKDLTLRIISGQKILITGESGTGKTSLLRVLARIWSPRSARSCIVINAHRNELIGSLKAYLSYNPKNVIFLPQDAYFPNGETSLLQQVAYPLNVKDVHCGWFSSLNFYTLICLCLYYILFIICLLRNTALSKGELQRLSIARLLYHKPKFAFLDECTSAVGKEMETRLYQLIEESNITYISVGHRENLKRFHQYELHLEGNGNWTFNKLNSVM